ncbi:Asp-tRNA(Asn)/Glu-tRNA(Gln) amidotransferase subunit GatB [candidate division WOR-3 bacterium]|uniref:Aspartyl/glutamyl-tRNA(Asn/Gln) amidotransferase subunit B n=1 Tax=candidate division WOR-3 bacterium TaxID=2052148 RepID=A0A9D5KB60_UNCW3|nr:Asp-tRNA(Asn)/Glu-tRNA(Gln) amidotransferase subunit GatB [candidate division WOR-3 bacterium]MBD3364536.1 Asp-tRNA(Asn)/Glu-tRNA(Gln) amidotransferase subunit GatB [candidate division WOR-3 bacterium]
MPSKKYEVIIGIEVHAQLATLSKMFCRCAVEADAPPNTKVCPVCLGLPGILPQTNKAAVELGIRAAQALGCKVKPESRWARKHYFSPDLPKGYQITQYEYPLATGGELELPGLGKKVRIRRLHLEEDAGKLTHTSRETLVDFNRCGIPLAEIVSEPDVRSPEEADAYLKELRQILRTVKASDAEMERGRFRCEPNISVRPLGQKELGVRSEIKNLNSFKAVREGIERAVADQIKWLEEGKEIVQTTYLWDEHKRELKPMRQKETAADYRYFPEPDLPPLILDIEWVDKIEKQLPELPAKKRSRLLEEGLTEQDIRILSAEPDWESYYLELLEKGMSVKEASTWLLNETRGILSARGEQITQFKVPVAQMASLITLLRGGKLSRPAAKELLAAMADSGKDAEVLIKEMDLGTVSDEGTLEETAKKVIAENPDVCEKYRKGKTNVIGFLLGQCMKELRGKADPESVRKFLKRFLD